MWFNLISSFYTYHSLWCDPIGSFPSTVYYTANLDRLLWHLKRKIARYAGSNPLSPEPNILSLVPVDVPWGLVIQSFIYSSNKYLLQLVCAKCCAVCHPPWQQYKENLGVCPPNSLFFFSCSLVAAGISNERGKTGPDIFTQPSNLGLDPLTPRLDSQPTFVYLEYVLNCSGKQKNLFTKISRFCTTKNWLKFWYVLPVIWNAHTAS